MNSPFDARQIAGGLRRHAREVLEQLGESEDPRQGFVQFVGDAGGELADRGQPVGMPQLILQTGLLDFGLPTFDDDGDLPRDRIEQPALFGQERPFVQLGPRFAVDDFDRSAFEASDQDLGPLGARRLGEPGGCIGPAVERDPRSAGTIPSTKGSL